MNVIINRMVKEFLVKVVDENNVDLYKNHSSFHQGDSGLDLFTISDLVIGGGETVLVDLGIQCQNRSFNVCVWQCGYKVDNKRMRWKLN